MQGQGSFRGGPCASTWTSTSISQHTADQVRITRQGESALTPGAALEGRDVFVVNHILLGIFIDCS